MTAPVKLKRTIVTKPWGRCGIDPRFGADESMKVGELWYRKGNETFSLSDLDKTKPGAFTP